MTYNVGGVKIPGIDYPTLHRTSSVYIDQDFLDLYVELLAIDTTWVPGQDAIARDASIVRSQIYVESLYYAGEKWWVDQVLQWPRSNVYDRSGVIVDGYNTPYDIFNAVAEGAYQEYKSPGILQPRDTDADQYPMTMTKVKAGSVETEKQFDTKKGGKKNTSAELINRLNDYLSHWVISASISIPIART